MAGRADPGGGVDRVTLLSGTWTTKPGELVLAINLQGDIRFMNPLGEQLTMPDLPGKPTLTIVGTAGSVSQTAGCWVSPDQPAALVAPGASGGYQMLYRFSAADTRAQIATGRAAVTAGITSALTAAISWLAVKQQNAQRSALFVPFLIAFGVLGLVMAVFVVGNVIAGAVSAGAHRIGILKALGFTPSQVIRAYLGRALIPAAVGAAFGVVVGNLLVGPLLPRSNRLYGTDDSGVAQWVDAVVIGGALGVAALTAWAAALRAGLSRPPGHMPPVSVREVLHQRRETGIDAHVAGQLGPFSEQRGGVLASARSRLVEVEHLQNRVPEQDPVTRPFGK